MPKIAAIAASIKEWGWTNPALVAEFLAERSRYAALMADRPPTPAEAAEHVARIDKIITGRP